MPSNPFSFARLEEIFSAILDMTANLDAGNRIDDLFQPVTSLQDRLTQCHAHHSKADRIDIGQLERSGVSAIVAITETSECHPYLTPRSHHPGLLTAHSL